MAAPRRRRDGSSRSVRALSSRARRSASRPKVALPAGRNAPRPPRRSAAGFARPAVDRELPQELAPAPVREFADGTPVQVENVEQDQPARIAPLRGGRARTADANAGAAARSRVSRHCPGTRARRQALRGEHAACRRARGAPGTDPCKSCPGASAQRPIVMWSRPADERCARPAGQSRSSIGHIPSPWRVIGMTDNIPLM